MKRRKDCITLYDLRELLNQFQNDEISISRFKECLNDLANYEHFEKHTQQQEDDFEATLDQKLDWMRKLFIWENTEHGDAMSKAMSKPNIPGYVRANND